MTPTFKGFFSRNLINVSVVTAGLMVSLLGALLGWQAYNAATSARQLQQVNAAVDELLSAAAYQARERGLTAAALGGVASLELKEALDRARAQGDISFSRALSRWAKLGVSCRVQVPVG